MFPSHKANMFLPDYKPLITNSDPFNYEREITLTVRRLDLIHPVSGGNKWFKLQYNLEKFFKGNYSQMVTFGGAFSNHIAAVAQAGYDFGFATIGVIRGEKSEPLNKTLSQAVNNGMKLIFISRSDYRKKSDEFFLKNILSDHDTSFILEEGGSNSEGVKGCAEILFKDDEKFTHVAVACGTGTTAAGILTAMHSNQYMIAFSVLKDMGTSEISIREHLSNSGISNLTDWHIDHNFHFGGYGKTTNELNNFCNDFYFRTGIMIEPVYTGKLFYGLEKMIAEGKFPAGSKILAIHTGGMQYIH